MNQDLQSNREPSLYKRSFRNIPLEAQTLLIEAKRNEGIWLPLPGPQHRGYLTEADELYYGGAAGGGKTDLLLGLAIKRHKRSIIFRREFPQLTDIVRRSHEILDQTGAKYNNWSHAWISVPERRTIEFGAVQYENDVGKWQGRPHDFIGFDEIPQFSEYMYLFLTAWARTTDPEQRVRIVACGNPPSTKEGEWVKRKRWAAWLDKSYPRPAKPGELRWFARLDDEDVEREDGEPFTHKGKTVKPRSRTFIPARLHDNPFLARTDYEAVLQALPEPLRSQLLYGDFEIGVEEDPWQVIPTEWVRLAMKRWEETEKPRSLQTSVGADIARGGECQTVVASRWGSWFARLKKYPGKQTPDGPTTAPLILKECQDGVPLGIDILGIGGSAYDICREAKDRVLPVAFSESSQATDRSGRLKLRNIRSEAYWGMREALDPDLGDSVALPPDDELLADLTAPRWSISTSGILIESKEAIVKRLHRSPDCGDAVVICNYVKGHEGKVEIQSGKKRQTWDMI